MSEQEDQFGRPWTKPEAATQHLKQGEQTIKKLTRDIAVLRDKGAQFAFDAGQQHGELLKQNAALVAALENSLKPLHAVHDGAKIVLHDPRLTCSVCETIREAEAALAAAKPQPSGNAG